MRECIIAPDGCRFDVEDRTLLVKIGTPFEVVFSWNLRLEAAGYPVDWMVWVGAEGA